MKLIIILLSIFGISQIKASPVGRIINGVPAEFVPHACLLFVRVNEGGTGLLGGGSIITDRHVITVAHLVHRALEVQVGFGALVATQMVTRLTSNIMIHPQFVEAPTDFDIAIIVIPITSPIEFNDVTQPIALPPLTVSPTEEPAAGTIAGFGFSFEGQTGASELRLATATVIGIDACEAAYGDRSLTTHFCAQDSSVPPSNLCPGDNGSGFYTGVPQLETEPSEETIEETGEETIEETIEQTIEETIEQTIEQTIEVTGEEVEPELFKVSTRKISAQRHNSRDGDPAVLVGMASLIPRTCVSTPAPVGYTRISFFRLWIGDIIGF